MDTTQVILSGILKPDGTLELSQPIALPPGQVEVTVKTASRGKPVRENTWELLERIWAERRASGRPPRSAEAIDAEITALRDEAEQSMEEYERLHQEAVRSRTPPSC